MKVLLSILLLASASSRATASLIRRKLPAPACGDGTCRKKCSDCLANDPECDGTCDGGGDDTGGSGGGGKNDCFGEPKGGVHVCSLESAHSKCGTKSGQSGDARYRHVVCCCHSDTCPSACCETDVTAVCGGTIDDALDEDGTTIRDQAMYDCMTANIDACNVRGNAGNGETYVDMVAKCALVDDATDGLYCPSGGATDPSFVPQEEVCNAASANACRNPWCNSALSNSCFDDPDLCLCEEQP